MPSLHPRAWVIVAVLSIIAPRLAPAQTVANSFEDVKRPLKSDQIVVVTDASGKRTKGKVAETFAEGTVTQVRAKDPLWNGALIGGAIGAGLATWDYLIDPSEPGNAAVFTVAIGLGTAIGTAVDAMMNRNERIIDAPPRRTRNLQLAPFVGKTRQGVLVSVCF
jgi:hypothetical protein